MKSYMFKFYVIFMSICVMLYYNCTSSQPQVNTNSSSSIQELAQIQCTSSIKEILELDGKESTDIKRSFYTGKSKLMLKPGLHTITVVFTTHEERTITFEVEIGQSYELDRWGDNVVVINMKNKKTWSEYQSQLYKGLSDELIDKQIRSYTAPLPGDNESIVRSLEHYPAVQLISIDNKRYSSINPGFALRLPPGPHIFEYSVWISKGFFQSSRYTPETDVISADLEPGCTYVIFSRIIDSQTKEVGTDIIKDLHHSVLSEDEKLVLEERLASKSMLYGIERPNEDEKVKSKQVKNPLYGFPWKFDELSSEEQETAIKLGYKSTDIVYFNKPFGGKIISFSNQPQIIVKKITYLDNNIVFYGVINLSVTHTIDVEEIERQGYEVPDVWVEISDEGRQLKYIDKSQVP
ncbi:hypothetical protein ACFL0J_08065 [Candidatus Neomarinimicrobiota bacterium]